MHQIRYVMVGGFLGAGKTTTIARLANHYIDAGQRVGIVTNDQAAGLVDTHSLRQQGFRVGEVAGACFCCQFSDLTGTMGELAESADGDAPDVILAEPVGSCTDLVATVIQPLKQLYARDFRIAPYCVILKPSHGAKILGGGTGGFSPKAAYILEKQLEEADAVLVNRADTLPPEELRRIVDLVKARLPATPVLPISARTGDGFGAVEELLAQDGNFGSKVLDIDYDTYAEGEAELGWLNCGSEIGGPAFALDDLLVDVIERLRVRLAAEHAEAAHVKTIGLWEGFYGVANLISSDTPVELSLASGCEVTKADVIVNARAAVDPEVLRNHAHAALSDAAMHRGLECRIHSTQSFRPGRPVPEHRFAATP